ncbi:carbon-nitrogen hydrolase family protein [Ponticoccus alexandrii]|uniref:Carbon-nitrogen hydrolase family protein n=1 Tax=Ponticoccus alexandrii TaxID=1943633 RepID=A0ABX7F9S0_9RHOB|nr:carbon-nitrogen hydrolase family protein [Ponticoccus alexandrii]KID12550.1 nitrilase [Rhodobacteraceae bacterium PD-2]QRF66443.1 carbon-nitrogen hydrolase family protein [Ponticoccus alexandrii]
MIAAHLVQFDVAPLDPARNFARMAEFIRAEAAAGADLILFPELSNTGYVEPLVPGGAVVSEVPHYGEALCAACADPGGKEIAMLAALAAELNVTLVAGLGLRDARLAGVIYNASALITPEGVVGHYVKTHQWQTEKLYFTPGDTLPVFPALGTRLGMQICYDIRFPEVTRALAAQGAEIVTSAWASFGADGAPVADEDLFVHRAYTRAVENGVFFLSCNRVGVQGDQRFFGRSCALGPDGRVLGRLDHDREAVLRVSLDLAEVTRYRSFTGIWADRRPDLYARILDPGKA